jgi:hypothetical protein
LKNKAHFGIFMNKKTIEIARSKCVREESSILKRVNELRNARNYEVPHATKADS